MTDARPDLLRRAAALNEAGQFAAAAEQLDALLAEDPQDTAARYQLARAQLGTGALDQAERNIGMVLAADPDDVGSLGMAAAVYSARGELGAARRAAAAAIRLTRTVRASSSSPRRSTWTPTRSPTAHWPTRCGRSSSTGTARTHSGWPARR